MQWIVHVRNGIHPTLLEGPLLPIVYMTLSVSNLSVKQIVLVLEIQTTSSKYKSNARAARSFSTGI